MSAYVLLERIKVQTANAIAGVTYGYPAITHFLGFTHALSRKLKINYPMGFTGCAIISHQHTLKTHVRYGDSNFIQSKCPPSTLMGKGSDANKTPPIIEEGKMDLTVSLLLECEVELSSQDEQQAQLKSLLQALIPTLRLAGGNIVDVGGIYLLGEHPQLIPFLKQKLLPAYFLIDQSESVLTHTDSDASSPNQTFDTWLAHFGLHYQVKEPTQMAASKQSQSVTWVLQDKPSTWLVPLALGYKGITPVLAAGSVANSRDVESPFVFTEMVYGVGAWVGIHKLQEVSAMIWRYHHHNEWYLAQQQGQQVDFDLDEEDIEPQ
ncbi:type I-F CRISPR-associated protein Csy2 [Vitreoscilla massiliensis]|uniref:Type I-F CRISPR-associated protein Csy2 n=1 Tax=Vitreoscilla massiliensis TaxID=1689272 RepID=A0ABY4E0J2_9NEIS|nr:type I-F CRISPR-associated protein Csy2 [Vitreoscilla massiliensis]UOO88881.1 type I-F CRISPR-associated protein Csy2 [Vitreoscilla massiliensis]